MPSRGRAALGGLALALLVGLGVLAWVALDDGTPAPALRARAEVARSEQRREEARELPGDEVASDAAAAPAPEFEPRVALAAEVLERSDPWSGTVVDVAGGAGIDGAEVELAAGERVRVARTDERGRFELAWPSDVPARLAIRHPRYVDAAAARADLAREGHFALERSAALRGHVQPAGVEGVVAAWLQATSSNRHWNAHEVPIAADGRFAFEDLEPGEYLLAARVGEHAVAPEAGLRLDPGGELELVLRARPGARLVGRVRSRPGNAPLAGLRVLAEPQGDDLPRDWQRASALETHSGADGRFELVGLGTGTWRVSAEDDQGGRTARNVEVTASGERLELELELDGAAALAGRVVDAAGAGVAGAEVAAFGRPNESGDFVVGRGAGQTVTDAAGYFRLDAARPGRGVQVVARAAPGRFGVERLTELEPGASRSDLLLVLRESHALAGRVLSTDGVPIPGARVRARVRLDTRTTSTVAGRSDAEGRFALDGLPGEGGHVDAEAYGWRRGGSDWSAAGGEVELRLEPAHTLAGQAIDTQGLAVAGLPITIRPVPAEGGERAARRERQSTRTNADGRFHFEELRPGPWQVQGGSYAWRSVGEEWRTLELPVAAPLELVFERSERPARAAIEGEVVLAGGGAPSGLALEGLRGGVLTVERGRFRASGVTPTRQQLTVRADGHARATIEPFDLPPGGLHDVGRVVLAPSTHLSVRVREKDGGDLSGASVRLVPLPVEEGGAGGDARALRLGPSPGGHYETTDATRHAWRLVVERKGYARHARRVEVLEQARQSITVELEPQP